MTMGHGNGGGGGGGGNPKKQSQDKVELCPEIKGVLSKLAAAERFYRHSKIGLEALPVFQEEYSDLTHFGIPIEMKTISIYEVPVLPNGWHVPVEQC